MSGHAAAPLAVATQRLSLAWFSLALGALGLSALCAAVLVVARTPFLGQGAAWFRTALVLHVNLAVTVWFLAVAAGLWSMSPARNAWLRWTPFWLALAGTLAMLVTPLTGSARPVLINYTPVLDHPLFLAGLMMFGAGVSLAGISSLLGNGKTYSRAWRSPPGLAVLALLAAVFVFLVDLANWPAHVQWFAALEDCLWGVGHSLQLVHVLLLMAAWQALGQEALARVAAFKSAVPWLFLLTLIPVASGPVIALAYAPGSIESHALFTSLMRWGSWPGATLLGLGLAVGMWRLRSERPLAADERALGLSIVLFVTGCLLGATIQVDTLTVPAHYHATVGAVTLAFLVWMRRLAPELGVDARDGWVHRYMPLAYGLGILVLVGGLAAGGMFGVARKSPHVELNQDYAAYFAALGTAGIGGFIALATVTTMVFIGLRAACRVCWFAGARRQDTRLWIAGIAVLAVALGGWLLKLLPGSFDGASSFLAAPVSGKAQLEMDQRFQQGVIMLHAKQYDHALTAFANVIQMAPRMPEAHVNAGFALLGLERFHEAHDLFEHATRLRKEQINAYYGIALALDGMGDLPGAMGAMQTYIHLTKPDDPFRAKAEVVLGRWRASVRRNPG